MKRKRKTYSEEFKQDAVNYHYSSGKSVKAAAVLHAIKKAKVRRMLEQPVIIRSDRGVHYVSKSYIDALPAGNFIRSYPK